MKKTANQIERRWKALAADRSTVTDEWEELTEFIMPSRRGFIHERDGNDVGAKDEDVADSTAMASNFKLSSSLHGAMTSPSSRWFSLDFANDDLNEDNEAREWIEQCADKMFSALHKSNFDSAISEAYLDYTGLATANLFVGEASSAGPFRLRFTAFHLSEIAVADGPDGDVDTVYRKYEMSAQNVVRKWPDADIPKVRGWAEDMPDKRVTVFECIEPNPDGESDAVKPTDRPWYHAIAIKQDEELVEEGGFRTKPHLVFRFFKQTGSPYGIGPGHLALPDIRSLNEAKLKEFDSWDKTIDPPLMELSGTVIGDMDLRSGGRTKMNDINGVKPMYEQTNWQAVQFKSGEAREQIQGIFYNHLLDFPGGPNVTATEIVRRVELMQREMGPMLGRLQTELLNPLIERIFDLMFYAGQFPEPPESVIEAAGSDIDVEYVSPLAKAQRSGDIDAIMRWAGALGQMAQMIGPEILDYVDAAEIPQLLADRMGTPAEAVRSEREIQTLRETRAKQQQEAMQAQLMAQQNGGQVPTGAG